MEKEQQKKREPVYTSCELDIDGLVGAIALSAWTAESGAKSCMEIYNDQGDIKEEWSDRYWQLHMAYNALVCSYIKEGVDM